MVSERLYVVVDGIGNQGRGTRERASTCRTDHAILPIRIAGRKIRCWCKNCRLRRGIRLHGRAIIRWRPSTILGYPVIQPVLTPVRGQIGTLSICSADDYTYPFGPVVGSVSSVALGASRLVPTPVPAGSAFTATAAANAARIADSKNLMFKVLMVK